MRGLGACELCEDAAHGFRRGWSGFAFLAAANGAHNVLKRFRFRCGCLKDATKRRIGSSHQPNNLELVQAISQGLLESIRQGSFRRKGCDVVAVLFPGEDDDQVCQRHDAKQEPWPMRIVVTNGFLYTCHSELDIDDVERTRRCRRCELGKRHNGLLLG